MKPLADEPIDCDPQVPGERLRCRFYSAVVCWVALTCTAGYGVAAAGL
jgi:hypothetical protein